MEHLSIPDLIISSPAWFNFEFKIAVHLKNKKKKNFTSSQWCEKTIPASIVVQVHFEDILSNFFLFLSIPTVF